MLRILTVVGHYLPGYKAGGPIRTISNLVDWLGDEFKFLIMTADRDLRDQEAYATIAPGRWQPIDKADVHYLSPNEQHIWRWRHWLRDADYDVLYLNGFFNSFTRSALGLRRLGLTPSKPVIVAPRGEFSPGALELKQHKKRFYLNLARPFDPFSGLIWQATSDLEADHIRSAIGGRAERIMVAPNLPARSASKPPDLSERPKLVGAVRVLFLSRVSRKKNLDFALRVLGDVTGAVDLDICGPIEDQAYWEECLSLARQLPAHISVSYQGEVHPSQVHNIFHRHHLLFLPTRGENFGHVILEALQAGCPVLTSDQTPWRHLSDKMAGWDLPLAEPTRFADILNAVVAMDTAAYQCWVQGALSFAQDFVSRSDLLAANRALFLQSSQGMPSILGRSLS